MRLARPAALLAAATLLLTACTSTEAGWTYAPPSEEPVPSGAPASGEPASPGASAPASAAASAPASAAASEAPASAPAGDAVQVSAVNIAFDQSTLDIPADAPFTIEFANNDNGVPHDVDIRDGGGAVVFDSQPFNGVETRQLGPTPPLPAGGYTFFCSIHPNMTIAATAG